MKKFKVGDVVFISGRRFLAGDRWFTVCTGELLTVREVCRDYYVLKWKGKKSIMTWGKKNAHKGDLTLYNKKNWCRVFLRLMEMMNESR